MYFFYILKCQGDQLYVGSCADLKIRFQKHQSGCGAEFTRRFPPEAVAYSEKFPTREEAVQRELQVKRWSQKKKRALIAGDFDSLKRLSISHD